MENFSLDEDMLSRPVNYATFFQRVGASIVDALCLIPIVGGSFYNNMSIKSMPLMLLLTIVMVAYKPVMEWYYGKTVGKMALNLQVTDVNGEKASLQAILLRNVFGIAAGVLSLISTWSLYANPDFMDAEGFMEMSAVQQQGDPVGLLGVLPSVALVLGAFVMFTNERKQCLHDIIGSTVVLNKSRSLS